MNSKRKLRPYIRRSGLVPRRTMIFLLAAAFFFSALSGSPLFAERERMEYDVVVIGGGDRKSVV